MRFQGGVEGTVTFEAVVSDIIAGFVNLPPGELDAAVTSALHAIVDALDLDRAVVWLRADGSDDLHPAHRWARPGVPLSDQPLSVRALFPWHWARIMAGQPACYDRVSDVPDATTRASIERFGAKSGATLSFSIDGQVAGAVAFATLFRERQWPPELVDRLNLVCRVLASAFARQRHDRTLAAAHGEVTRLSEELRAENRFLRKEMQHALGAASVVGQSPAIRSALDLAAHVGPTDSTVLLRGETGSGKELFASHLHDLSTRRDRMMIRVNCAAIPATLIESELFGREKGAYTGALTRQAGRFELADKSTLFLDEIGDLPMDTQVKLLRVLEDQQVERLGSSKPTKVDVRIIAATHRDLEAMVAAGSFREDLYYRLNVFPIQVPPLRERPGDIEMLTWRFVNEFSRRFGKAIDSLDQVSVTALERYHWPGNVRELRNIIERAMIMAPPGERLVIPVPVPASPQDVRSVALLDVEIAHIRGVLESCGWRVRGAAGAAERLGLKPSTLETRMAKHGIRRPARA
jgi:transcriptional regulator with GAF, ATPase, and Fis domain